MGTILVSEIIAKARAATFDEGVTPRHSDLVHLGFLDTAQRQAVLLSPDANVRNEPFQLAAGTLQSVPAWAVHPGRLICNMGADGTTAGRAIFYEDLDKFTAKNPFWHASDAHIEVRWWMQDKRDPDHFYVFPPQPASPGWVRGAFPAAPERLGGVDAPIGLADTFEDVLLDYDLYRLYDIEAAINPFARVKSDRHWNLFVTALGRLDLIKRAQEPRTVEEKERADADQIRK